MTKDHFQALGLCVEELIDLQDSPKQHSAALLLHTIYAIHSRHLSWAQHWMHVLKYFIILTPNAMSWVMWSPEETLTKSWRARMTLSA